MEFLNVLHVIVLAFQEQLHFTSVSHHKQITNIELWGAIQVLEQETATHSSILACKIPWTEEPGGLQSMGSHRVGHDWSDLAAAAAAADVECNSLCYTVDPCCFAISIFQCLHLNYCNQFLIDFSFHGFSLSSYSTKKIFKNIFQVSLEIKVFQ